ncbi:MAG: glycoside hydrolase family 99-like domain-containing protein [Candidatus Saccharibacteria bacterium]|nr:glycoside hydrolase family 99-like domain-containing protein [Candidatus Saccharibacteria bacterium]
MVNDPNRFDADIYVCKHEINRCKRIIKTQKKEIEDKQATIDDLSKKNQAISEELVRILNSKGWRALERVRKIIPRRTNEALLAIDETEKPLDETAKRKIKLPYNSHYEDNIDFSKIKAKPSVKAIAFYLPQFHTFPENDKWWGEGFTEWTNTKKAKPRFEEHYEPREPHNDIGYYALDDVETIRKQVQLAKQHGLYGFCFYYYWFSGKRLMEKPVDLFLKDATIDFPFCLCWANENWTRTWDGLNKNILIRQEYKKKDPERFIIDAKKYLMDSRYIRIDGKPVILVYAPNAIPDFRDTVKKWREIARNEGIGEIVVWSRNSILDDEFENTDTVDGEFDFAPIVHPFFIDEKLAENEKNCKTVNYSEAVEYIKESGIYHEHTPVKPFYYSCTMGWDNSPRRKDFFAFNNYSPEKFHDWLSLIIEETKRRHAENERFVLINAWNEWAEGTYLEPDKKYGYTNINAMSKAIYDLPYNFEKKQK